MNIVEVGVIAFPTTMEGLFPQLIEIMMNTKRAVLKITQEPGGTKPVTILISMG